MGASIAANAVRVVSVRVVVGSELLRQDSLMSWQLKLAESRQMLFLCRGKVALVNKMDAVLS